MRLIIAILLAVIIVTACDDRDPDKPEMVFTTDRDTVYSLDNYETCSLRVELSGNLSYIADQKINFDYDDNFGFIFGAGHATYDYTDSNGVVVVPFYVKDDVFGITTITAQMESFESVHQSVTLTIHTVPVISFVTADSSIATNSVVDLDLSLTSPSGNISNQRIEFTIDDGAGQLEFNHGYTDTNGVFLNSFHAPGSAGNVIISAWLSKFPALKVELSIIVE